MKQHRCIPTALGLPVIFGMFTLVGIYEMFFFSSINEPDGVYAGLFVSLGSVLFTVSYLLISVRRVEIHATEVICKGLLPKHTFSIEYGQCNIGMDFHVQNYNKIWWIYLCYGPPPQYKSDNRANRMNSVKIRPGFVKIMYSDEVYDELINVLPKKQKTALISARRCVGFEKQGKIIF